MKPPILEWKIAVALVVIVAGAVSLGSALRSNQANATHVRVFYTYGLNQVPATTGGTTLTSRKTKRMECMSFRSVLRGRVPKAVKAALIRDERHACRRSRRHG